MNPVSTHGATHGMRARRISIRVVLFALMWVLLAEGDLRGWVVAAPVIALAVWLSLILRPPSAREIRLSGAIRFIPYFLWTSLRGGFDVAMRAYRSPPRVDPALVDFRPRLAEGSARMFFVTVLGLLPGTLGAARAGDSIRIHTIDRRQFDEAEVRRLERHVARLFGEPLLDQEPSIASTTGRGTPPT